MAAVLSGYGATEAVASRAGRTVTVTEANNGQTVSMHDGDVLVATLASTYWQFNRPTGVLIADRTTAVVAGGAHCPTYPGSGCGTVTQRYRATNAGTGTASASRTSCGEALPCSAEQSRWRITVHVSTPGVHTTSFGVVSGSVTAGPTCPVERPGQSCPPRAVRGTIRAIGTAGLRSTTARITPRGRYSLRLRPGRYQLAVDTGATFPRCPVTQVIVAAGDQQRLDISCDTGIR